MFFWAGHNILYIIRIASTKLIWISPQVTYIYYLPSLPPAWWRLVRPLPHHRHTGYCLVSTLMAPLSPPLPTVAPRGCQWPGTGDRRTMYLYCSFCSLWHSQTSPHMSKWWHVLYRFLQISIRSAMFVPFCLADVLIFVVSCQNKSNVSFVRLVLTSINNR